MPKFELEKNDDLRPAALLCYTKGSHRVRKVQFFLTLFKKAARNFVFPPDSNRTLI